ncbi:DUF362 domain-containing protein [Cloacibacillus sp. An23]|uniref:DUF362 domain-containing protein n=1 Tax=Cloacibacillus sp. An23 TaxID=1965591 RepID=UPI000B375DD1|nr:DUF362 domain-containing protein [Cloacibacillus sp. An23]OUO94490.1 hypothetical protein B5F39_04325 [Cloacibacillus sp. An23]
MKKLFVCAAAFLCAALAAAGAEAAVPKVYFTKEISPEGIMKVYNALEKKAEGKNVAVKISTGEPPASHPLDAKLIKELVQHVKGSIVECNTAYGGARGDTFEHMRVALERGYTSIAYVDILDADGSMALPVKNGKHLKEDLVGSRFKNYDYYVVLSHFKGHAMAGFGGAIKNISIGLGSRRGKALIHSGGRSTSNVWCGEQDAFLESMAEAGKAVTDALGGKILYVSVLNNISVDCDCNPSPAKPEIHDIGVLASTDPVAIDQASIDLAFAAEGSRPLVERVESRSGLHTLEYAEQIGLGSRKYELVKLD